MKIWLRQFCASLIFGLFVTISVHAQETLVDRIVAVVNGVPLLYSEIQEKMQTGFFTVTHFPAPDDAPMFDKALQDAINFELILQKADELEIEVSDADLDQEIESNLRRRGQTKEALLQALEQAGIDYEDYREDFRDQIIFRRFQGMVIRPLVKITDKDVETFFMKKSGTSAESLQLTLRQILIQVPDGAVEEIVDGKHKLARTVYQKLQSGMDFAEAVKVYSDAPGARENGGKMAGIRLKDLAPQIADAVKGLEKGAFTAPVRTPLGFHIFYLEDKDFSGGTEFERQKNQLETELFMAESEVQTRRWLSDFRKKNEVKVLK